MAISNKGEIELDQEREVFVPHSFTDTISDIKIKESNMSYFVAVSSWDGNV